MPINETPVADTSPPASGRRVRGPAPPGAPHRLRGREPVAGPGRGARPLARRAHPGDRTRDLEPAPGVPGRRAAAPAGRPRPVAAAARGQPRPADGRGADRQRGAVRPAAPRGRRRARPRPPARRARGGDRGRHPRLRLRAHPRPPAPAGHALAGAADGQSLHRRGGRRCWSAWPTRSGSPSTMRGCTRRRGISSRSTRRRGRRRCARSGMSAIDGLAAGVAHEINNPLTIILGQIHVMLQGDPDEELQTQLRVIDGAAKRAAKIVKDLRSFAEPTPAQRAPVSIAGAHPAGAGRQRSRGSAPTTWSGRPRSSRCPPSGPTARSSARCSRAWWTTPASRWRRPTTAAGSPSASCRCPRASASRCRRRTRHPAEPPAPHLQPVLHHQGAGSGARARARRGPRRHQGARRPALGRERPRPAARSSSSSCRSASAAPSASA